MEWVNDGVTSPSHGVYVVAWRPADGSDRQVVTTYGMMPVNKWRGFRIHVQTYYRSGGWEHQVQEVRGEPHRTRDIAQAWAKRDAELEAANVHAIGWDGEPS